jgi:uncharacterized membrane protein
MSYLSTSTDPSLLGNDIDAAIVANELYSAANLPAHDPLAQSSTTSPSEGMLTFIANMCLFVYVVMFVIASLCFYLVLLVCHGTLTGYYADEHCHIYAFD